MTDWFFVVKRIAPQAHLDIAHGLADVFPALCARFDLSNDLRRALIERVAIQCGYLAFTLAAVFAALRFAEAF